MYDSWSICPGSSRHVSYVFSTRRGRAWEGPATWPTYNASMSLNGSAVLEKIVGWYPELATLPPDVFAVGGVVRDALLNREPLDADLTARSASELARNFASRHATYVVELGRDPMQVHRVVVGGRVYDFVEMTGDSIEEDLLRRDFTMNAIALEMSSGRLIDPLHGADDIERRLVRMISEQNFRDDPLRIVKAVRMAVKFDFRIESATLEAMSRNVGMIPDVAVERVTYELRAILTGPRAAYGVALMSESGIDQVIFGRQLTDEDVQRIGAGASQDADISLAILLADLNEAAVREFALRWKLSTASLQAILAIHRMAAQLRSNPDLVRTALYDFGRETSERAVAFSRAVGNVEAAKLIERVAQKDGDRIFALQPLLTGEEIGALSGMPPGRGLGALKRRMIEAQIRGELATREDAEKWIGRNNLSS